MKDEFGFKAFMISHLQRSGADRRLLGRLRIWSIRHDVVAKIAVFLVSLGFSLGLGLMLIGLLFLMTRSSHATWRPEMAQEFTPEEQTWFNRQLVPAGPNKGTRCCNTADGTFAQEDIRNGHYWTRYHYRYYSGVGVAQEGDTDWVEVPDNTVIHEPNRHGSPAVWYHFVGGPTPVIRCYSPGAGL